MNNTLFKKEIFNKCEICAYHEAGHILFAYLCGYACNYVELINSKANEDFSSIVIIDYGRDAELASKFVAANANLDYFKTLSLGMKLEAIEVGRRIARIYLGGSVAAAVYNNGGNYQVSLPMQIDVTDLFMVEFINQVLKESSSDTDENFIEYNLQDALYTMANPNYWNTIEDIAKRLLHANELSRNDIEECLEEHGILHDESAMDVNMKM
jgi:hypothetical protein